MNQEPADFYTGIVVDVYTALRASHFGADRYRAFVDAHGQPALELGCGDDGPFFDLAAAGYAIEGVDASADMVQRGRERLTASGVDTAIHHQRMESLDLPRRFASIYLAGPTFNLLPDDGVAAAALRRIAAHLAPGGAALVPLWTPPPTRADQLGLVRTSADGTARYAITRETYDRDRRTRTSTLRYELDTAGGTQVVERDWVIHWFTREGFAALASAEGLTVTWARLDDEQDEATLGLSAW